MYIQLLLLLLLLLLVSHFPCLFSLIILKICIIITTRVVFATYKKNMAKDILFYGFSISNFESIWDTLKWDVFKWDGIVHPFLYSFLSFFYWYCKWLWVHRFLYLLFSFIYDKSIFFTKIENHIVQIGGIIFFLITISF